MNTSHSRERRAPQGIPREAAVRQIDPICDALADERRWSAGRAERRLGRVNC